MEITAEGRPLTEIVEMGLSAPFSASDCVGALFRELRRYSTKGEIKLLVAIDHANSLYGKCIVQKADHSLASPNDLTLVVHVKKFLKNNWTNGVCVLVADRAEVASTHDRLAVPLHTPLELFGDKGFDDVDPFIPIETTNYTKAEANVLYDYYSEMNWITKAKVPEAREQIFYLSGSNPFHYERICSFT